MTCVLVLDDDAPTRRRVVAGLRDGGYDVEVARSLQKLGSLLRRRQVVGVIVDPGEDGPAEVIRDLRARTDLPIIVVSSHVDEWEKVALLDAGADDHVTKPFGTEELLARFRAVLRRSVRVEESVPIVTDDLTIHLDDRRLVRSDGTEAPLSPTEWKIIEVLTRHPGHLMPHEEILRTVWGPDAAENTRLLRVHMTNIRRKVEPDPARPRYFLTVAGLGLRFAPDGSRAKDLAG